MTLNITHRWILRGDANVASDASGAGAAFGLELPTQINRSTSGADRAAGAAGAVEAETPTEAGEAVMARAHGDNMPTGTRGRMSTAAREQRRITFSIRRSPRRPSTSTPIIRGRAGDGSVPTGVGTLIPSRIQQPRVYGPDLKSKR